MASFQDVSGCFNENNPKLSALHRSYREQLDKAQDILQQLRQDYEDGTLKLLNIPENHADLQAINELAEKIKNNYDDVIFLGTGGSSLGGQTLVQLAGWQTPAEDFCLPKPRLHFLDNLDPNSLHSIAGRCNFEKTFFVVISKSGGTAETLIQLAVLAQHHQSRQVAKPLSDCMIAISDPEKPGATNKLRAFCRARNIQVFDHEAEVGGRYSFITNVGLLPAAIAGVDILALRMGATDVLTPVLASVPPEDCEPVVAAAVTVALAESCGVNETVLFGYGDTFQRLLRWFVQLWAESIGKDNKGITPVAALGPVDQHSQAQLFLDGPRNKVITTITVDTKGQGDRIGEDMAQAIGEPEFAGIAVGDFTYAQSCAMGDTLIEKAHPVIRLTLEALDARSLGGLLMYFVLKTIVACRLVGVDPFDQPAVEAIKVRSKERLKSKV